VDPVESACEHQASPFSPDAQPFQPKTLAADESVVISEKAAPHILSPNAPEFVPKYFKPPVKVLLLDYIRMN